MENRSIGYFRRRNRNLRISRASLNSQAHQGISLFTSAATNQCFGCARRSLIRQMHISTTDSLFLNQSRI